ncbi:MAG: hypothetical protein SGI97_07720 [candidate division Zixibacteria bacterium]|nr:hypothetical protein [candidate division Zixibacteria bacterium]
MNRFIVTLFGIVAFVVAPSIISAQIDPFGKTDTVFADLAKIDDRNWSITISYTNDEPIVGMSVPFKMTAGLNRITADSAIWTGGRVSHFEMKAFRADTAIQCVTLGLIATLGSTKARLAAGSGRLVTIYVSSIEDKPITSLSIDTVTTNPDNSLLVIAEAVQGIAPDTVKVEMKDRQIVPAWVVRKSQ